MTYYDQRKGIPLHVKVTIPKSTDTPRPEENEKPTEEAVSETSTLTAVEQEVIKSVPNIYKAGPKQLLDKIKEHQNVLHWNDRGELLYENKPIPGSHVVDLVNDSLSHRKGFEPPSGVGLCLRVA